MNDSLEGIAPAVRGILASARERPPPPGGPIAVEARPVAGSFAAAEADGRVPVIAEVKPTSPTTDGVRGGDPVELAGAMVDGGAAALSVLTEPDHFEGSTEALARVREAVDVPVLRKDFLLDERQLDAVEADAVLLIARFLDDLGGMVAAARDRGFQPLVEVHTPGELTAALEAGADLIGVNNRDLARLEVDLGTFESVAGEFAGRCAAAGRSPEAVTLVAESGIGGPGDAVRMRRAGADALLVGSAIMDGDVEANTRELVDAERGTGT